jgi:branched-chain amino acid transport system substrate-binding protein
VWVGLVSDFSNRPIRRLAAELARREIATVAGGLPPTAPGAARRPFALVACNSTRGVDAIFQHLINTLKLPAVIGPDKSGDAFHAVTTYTLPAGAVVIGNNTTAGAFTTLPTHGLFLRLLASDAWQGKVDALFISRYVEPELRRKRVVAPGEPMRVFLAYKGDLYGNGIADILVRNLRFNRKSAVENGPNFQRVTYSNPDDPANTHPELEYAAVAARIVAQRPHVIAFAGTTEMLHIVQAVESAWPTTVPYRPMWIGTDGAGVIAARNSIADTTFARRLMATTLRVDFDEPIAKHVVARIEAEHADVVQQDPRSVTALATYDAVYALAYAITALGSRPLTGAAIAAALRKLNQRHGPTLAVGEGDLREILARLQNQQSINLKGTTGALDWDKNGDVEQNLDIVCVRTTASRANMSVSIGTKPSGLYYDIKRRTFVGSVSGCPGP